MAGDPWARAVPFVMIFGGCMSAIVAMEYVLQADPAAGNLISLTEFVFVLLQSIPGRLEEGSFRLRPLRMPWSNHAVHALLWVSMSILANHVFQFKINVPIHTLFRSCNVIASVMLGWLAFGQRYTIKQLACVVIITSGIFLGSIGDSTRFKSSCAGCNNAGGTDGHDTTDDFTVWMMGIAMLVLVQTIQATLGHTQAYYYKKFEDRGSFNELADEFLFTAHAVSFFPLLLLREDITAAFRRAVASPPVSSLVPIPTCFVWMGFNNIFQLMCIKGVFRLAANFSPLTVNITLSVRKFLSLVVSILWFGNTWTFLHSSATVAIFGGVFAYSQCKGHEKKE